MRRVLSHLEAAASPLQPLPWADPAIPPRAPRSGHRGRQRASAVAGPTAHPGFAAPRGPRWPLAAGRRPPGLPASLPPRRQGRARPEGGGAYTPAGT